MDFKNTDKKTLRKYYIDYIISTGKAPNTATTTANSVFALWNKCGKEFFWKTVYADGSELRDIVNNFVQTYYPKQIRWVSGYFTSIRYFKDFLAADFSGGRFVNTELTQQESSCRRKPKTLDINNLPPVRTLTGEMLEAEHQKVLDDPGYGSDSALIDSVFKRFPYNTDPEIVALKIALIDMTNSTNIARQREKIVVKELANIIVGIEGFDYRLMQGDPELVNIIAKSNGEINLFSFASKYCTYHSVSVYGHDDYVIFDRVVKEALPKYIAGVRKSDIEKWRKTYNYGAYKDCIDKLLDANNIHIPFRRRKLDHYLWYTNRK